MRLEALAYKRNKPKRSQSIESPESLRCASRQPDWEAQWQQFQCEGTGATAAWLQRCKTCSWLSWQRQHKACSHRSPPAPSRGAEVRCSNHWGWHPSMGPTWKWCFQSGPARLGNVSHLYYCAKASAMTCQEITVYRVGAMSGPTMSKFQKMIVGHLHLLICASSERCSKSEPSLPWSHSPSPRLGYASSGVDGTVACIRRHRIMNSWTHSIFLGTGPQSWPQQNLKVRRLKCWKVCKALPEELQSLQCGCARFLLKPSPTAFCAQFGHPQGCAQTICVLPPCSHGKHLQSLIVLWPPPPPAPCLLLPSQNWASPPRTRSP